MAHGRQWFHALCGTHRFYKSRRHPPLHEADYSLSFTERLGIAFSLADANPRLIVDPAEQAGIAARIDARVGTDGPLFGVHPGHRTRAPSIGRWRIIWRLFGGFPAWAGW